MSKKKNGKKGEVTFQSIADVHDPTKEWAEFFTAVKKANYCGGTVGDMVAFLKSEYPKKKW